MLRGDAETLRLHRKALRLEDPAIDAVYAAVMTAAIPLARARGLGGDALVAVEGALAQGDV